MNMNIAALKQAYGSGELTPRVLIQNILEKSRQKAEHNIWIYQLSEAELEGYLQEIEQRSPDELPLWGIPFAIKDNIDLAGVPTTAGCEAYAYLPERSAPVVEQLIAAGAIPLGKTNLDQFATGLNGTRSFHGACRNAFDPDYISGGSSSGSAVAVALGLASFSLGTDTAGSGRIPACFNNLVGLKPTRGLLSTRGVVPACRSLDCVSVFALNVDDANQVLAAAEAEDPQDGFSRANRFANSARHFGIRTGTLRVGVIPERQLSFFGDASYQQAYLDTLEKLEDDGFQLIEVDYEPFDEVARLLYEGPWVSERYIAMEAVLKRSPDAVHPVVRKIVEAGESPAATALFRAQYRLEELRKHCLGQLETLDCLLTPTAGRLFTIDEMLAEPVQYNSQLGYYTNFMNLLDLAAVAVPTAFTAAGLPFGISLVGKAFSDRALLTMANRIQRLIPLPQGRDQVHHQSVAATVTTSRENIDVMVCGAHLDGQPLNWQLRERGATLKSATRTAPIYRMYALAGGPPLRPGLVLDEAAGTAIEVEVWSVPAQEFGSFVAGIPAPLGIGKVQLEQGGEVSGFICEPYGLEGAEEISAFGGWKRWLASR
ncbi:allophanate hydrolase [Microbulbifer bruguierae]|uniref:Allophanate hydrolase n=1 Tax=Microbulbifer bruguierae TaxID=3029061 RepID=A0ABY8NGP2_9GAMM|nr:allophanate hydrolase [Microbulbifer bruguierae]WGL17772.1 allophanate hydrolase [Microbulbifer bruguierae]